MARTATTRRGTGRSRASTRKVKAYSPPTSPKWREWAADGNMIPWRSVKTGRRTQTARNLAFRKHLLLTEGQLGTAKYKHYKKLKSLGAFNHIGASPVPSPPRSPQKTFVQRMWARVFGK